MFEKIKSFGHKIATKGKLAIATGGAATAAALGTVIASAEGETSTFTVPLISQSVTSNMMNGIMEQITSLLPIVLPVLVGVLAFRKGLSFFIGMIRGL